MKFTDILLIIGGMGFLGFCFWVSENGYARVAGAIAVIIIGVFLIAAQIHAIRSSRIKRGR
jgi:succinate dehydrogenase hydrophobic anchor subunit